MYSNIIMCVMLIVPCVLKSKKQYMNLFVFDFGKYAEFCWWDGNQ